VGGVVQHIAAVSQRGELGVARRYSSRVLALKKLARFFVGLAVVEAF
jgi:hypothetical protein